MTTSNTTSNTTSINELAFAGVLAHGQLQLRKGAINTVMAIACYMAHTETNAGLLACARLRGNDLTAMPSKTSTDAGDKAILTQAKKDSALASKVFEALPHLDPIFLGMLKALSTHLADPVNFEDEAEKIIASLGFFAGVVIDTQKKLLEFFESRLPSERQQQIKAEKEAKRVKAEKQAQEKADAKTAKKKPTTVESGTKASEAAAQALAVDYLKSLAEEYPMLKTTIALTSTVKTKEQAAQVMAQAFEDMLNEAKAEIATLQKIKTPNTPSTKRKKATPAPAAK